MWILVAFSVQSPSGSCPGGGQQSLMAGHLAGWQGRRDVEVPAGLDVRLVALSQTEIASELRLISARLATEVQWNRRLADEI